MYSSSPSAPTATSPVEELPGIFSRESKVSWDTAQELYDVGYVIYRAEREGGRKDKEAQGEKCKEVEGNEGKRRRSEK